MNFRLGNTEAMKKEETIEELEQLSYLTKLQAAKYVGVSDRTIANHVASGRLNVKYEGNKGMYDINQLRTLKQENTERLNERVKREGGNTETVEAEALNPESLKPERVGTTLTLHPESRKSEARKTESVQLGNGVSLFMVSEEQLSELVEKAGQGYTMQELAVKTLLTFPEAAVFTGISEKRLRDAAKANELPTSKNLGRAQKLRRVDLDKWVDSQF